MSRKKRELKMKRMQQAKRQGALALAVMLGTSSVPAVYAGEGAIDIEVSDGVSQEKDVVTKEEVSHDKLDTGIQAEDEIEDEKVSDEEVEDEIVDEEVSDEEVEDEIVDEEASDEEVEDEIVDEEVSDEEVEDEIVDEEVSDEEIEDDIVDEEVSDDEIESEIVDEEVSDEVDAELAEDFEALPLLAEESLTTLNAEAIEAEAIEIPTLAANAKYTITGTIDLSAFDGYYNTTAEITTDENGKATIKITTKGKYSSGRSYYFKDFVLYLDNDRVVPAKDILSVTTQNANATWQGTTDGDVTFDLSTAAGQEQTAYYATAAVHNVNSGNAQNIVYTLNWESLKRTDLEDALIADLLQADANLGGAVVGFGDYVTAASQWVTEVDYNTYATAVAKAHADFNTITAQDDVTTISNTLSAATAAFETAKKAGEHEPTLEVNTDYIITGTIADSDFDGYYDTTATLKTDETGKATIYFTTSGTSIGSSSGKYFRNFRLHSDNTVALNTETNTNRRPDSNRITTALNVAEEQGSYVTFDLSATAGNESTIYFIGADVRNIAPHTHIPTFYTLDWSSLRLDLDTDVLTSAISGAEASIKAVEISTVGTDVEKTDKWVTQDVYTAYQTAITAAQKAFDDNISQDAIDTAVSDLATATETFNDAKQAGKLDLSPLTTAISEAEENLASVKISVDGAELNELLQWVTQENYNTYNQAIQTAKDFNAITSNDDVTSAVNTLATATDTFNGAKADGGITNEGDVVGVFGNSSTPLAVGMYEVTVAMMNASKDDTVSSMDKAVDNDEPILLRISQDETTKEVTATIEFSVNPVNMIGSDYYTKYYSYYEGGTDSTKHTATVLEYDSRSSDPDAVRRVQFKITDTSIDDLFIEMGYDLFGKASTHDVRLEVHYDTAEAYNLAKIIQEAEENLASVTVSEDGAEVLSSQSWVLTADATTYQNAINTAKAIDLENADEEAGMKTLLDATTTFNDTKKAGLVDISALQNAISAAKTNLESVTVSIDGKDIDVANEWVTQAVYTTYSDAITKAESDFTTVETAEEILTAVETLEDATSTFDDAKAFGTKIDTTALESAVDLAKVNLASVIISTDGEDVVSSKKWVTQAVYDAYNTAIQTAEARIETIDTDDDVTAAISTLSSATSTFDDAKLYGLKSNSYGSSELKLSAGVYQIPVALKNAANIAEDSMAASAIDETCEMVIDENGAVSLNIDFKPVTVGATEGYASDIKYYTDNVYPSSLIENAVVNSTYADGSPKNVTLQVTHTELDGLYIGMTIAAINMSPDAYLSLDYANATVAKGYGSQGIELEAGTYTVPIRMGNEYDHSIDSMADKAIEHTATLNIAEDGKTTITYNFIPMDFNGTEGYAHNIKYYTTDTEDNSQLNDDDLVDAKINSVHEAETRAPHSVTMDITHHHLNGLYVMTDVIDLVGFHEGTVSYLEIDYANATTVKGYGSQGIELEAGTYTVPISMVQENDHSKPSMADNAIEHTATLNIAENGKTTITYNFIPMDLNGTEGYASNIKYYTTDTDDNKELQAEDLVDAIVNSVHEAETRAPYSVTMDITHHHLNGLYVMTDVIDLDFHNGTVSYLIIDYARLILDKTALDSAITEAKLNLASVAESNDGTDVALTQYWATAEQIATYQSAIDDAQTVYNTASSADEIDIAITNLASATTTFNSTKNIGTSSSAVDTTALSTAIADAKDHITHAEVSENGEDVLTTAKWVTQADLTAYQSAITTAQAVLDDVGHTAEQVAQAVTTLATATTAFENATQDGKLTFTNLQLAINEANTNLNSVSVSTDGKDVALVDEWVTEEVYNVYAAAIATAENSMDSATNLTQVNEAISTLASATTVFDGAKKDGTKEEVAPLKSFEFGSKKIELKEGSYEISVALKQAYNQAEDSMAAGAIGDTCELVIDANGNASLNVQFNSVMVGTIEGYATSLEYFTDKVWSSSGNKVPAEVHSYHTINGNSTYAPKDVTFKITHNDLDGLYLNTFVDAMGMAQNVYMTLDYEALYVDTTELDSAITDANINLASVIVSADGTDVALTQNWVTQAIYNAYQSAIADAQTVLDNATSTSAITTAIENLATATTTFDSAKKLGTSSTAVDTTELELDIATAKNNLSSVIVSVDGSDVDSKNQWVTSAVYDAYQTAIETAQSALESATTQTEIDDAQTALISATTVFDDAKKAGTNTPQIEQDGYGSTNELLSQGIYTVNIKMMHATKEDTESSMNKAIDTESPILLRIDANGNTTIEFSVNPVTMIGSDYYTKYYSYYEAGTDSAKHDAIVLEYDERSTDIDAVRRVQFVITDKISDDLFIEMGYDLFGSASTHDVRLEIDYTTATAIDITGLQSAIATATENLANVSVSVDGSDVDSKNQWVTSAVYDAYQTAIKTADSVLSSATTQIEIDDAQTALISATTVFDDAKKAGTKVENVDKTALESDIASARKDLLIVKISENGTEVFENETWVTQAVYNTYEKAIQTADSALESATTQTAIDNAQKALASATATFETAKKDGTLAPTALSNAVKSARSNLVSVEISTDGTDVDKTTTWVTQAVYTAYQKAIQTADDVVSNEAATTKETLAALSNLNTATNTFNAAKTAGTKGVVTFGFGSTARDLKAGTYTIPVALKNAYEQANDSMAAKAIDETCELVIDANGNASLNVQFNSVMVGEIVGYATSLEYFTDEVWSTYGTKVPAVVHSYHTVNGNSKYAPKDVTFKITHKELDGLYLNTFVDAMGMAQDVYMTLDYSKAERTDAVLVGEGDSAVELEYNTEYSVPAGATSTDTRLLQVIDTAETDSVKLNIDATGKTTLKLTLQPILNDDGTSTYVTNVAIGSNNALRTITSDDGYLEATLINDENVVFTEYYEINGVKYPKEIELTVEDTSIESLELLLTVEGETTESSVYLDLNYSGATETAPDTGEGGGDPGTSDPGTSGTPGTTTPNTGSGSSSSGGGGGTSSTVDITKNGTYSVPIKLMHAYNDNDSMGDGAFDGNRNATVVTKDGTYTVTMGLGTVQVGTLRGGLASISSTDGRMNITDRSYGTDDLGATYISKVVFTTDDLYDEFKVSIYAELMGVTQSARLVLDWDSVKSGSSSLSVDESGDADALDVETSTVIPTVTYMSGAQVTVAQIDELVENNHGLLVEGDDDIEMVFYKQALSYISRVIGSYNIRFFSSTIDATSLTEEQQEFLGKTPLFEISAIYNNRNLTSLNGNAFTVSVPFEISEADNENIFVRARKFDLDGTITELDATYDPEEHIVTFETDTFGIFNVYETYVEGSAEEEFYTWFNEFEDIDMFDWFYHPVIYVLQNKLFYGVSDTEFSPNTAMTREMLVTVLHRYAGTPEVDVENKFYDVDVDQYYANAVAWASENGIVAGYSEDMFGVSDSITREQLVTILYRYSNNQGMNTDTLADLSAFEDLDSISDYAMIPMQWAVDVNLVYGTSETTLSAQKEATRAEVAAILMRYIENIIS